MPDRLLYVGGELSAGQLVAADRVLDRFVRYKAMDGYSRTVGDMLGKIAPGTPLRQAARLIVELVDAIEEPE